MSKTSNNSTATTLSDICYDEVEIPEINESDVVGSIQSHEDFFNLEQADIFWIKGEEYVIIDSQYSLMTKDPLYAVSENGDQGLLISGTTNDGSAGVAWLSTIAPKSKEDTIRKSDLIAEFEHVHKTDTERYDRLHEWVPNTDSRSCPSCRSDTTQEPIEIERQGDKAIELWSCIECDQVNRYVRDFPEPDAATVLEYNGKQDHTNPHTISGVFMCKRKDQFTFPVDTNTPRSEGFYTAQEVADFVNPKMVGEDKAGVVSVKDDTRWGENRQVVKWKSSRGLSAPMTVEFRRINEPNQANYAQSMARLSYSSNIDIVATKTP